MKATEQNALILQYQPMLWKIAGNLIKKYARLRQQQVKEDLVQAGNLALLDACRLYRQDNPWKAKFITYAYRSVKQRMMREVEDSMLVCIPHGAVKRMMSGEKRYVRYIQQAQAPIHSLPVELDRLASKESDREDYRMESVRRAVSKLPSKDKELLERRFGLWSGNTCTLASIAKDYGVSKEAVRQRFLTIYRRICKDMGEI